ncbi:hypothetical protein LLG95_02610 [bacterium]|nr:hypothetical protein [bacterium]
MIGQIGGHIDCQALEGNILLTGIGSYVKVIDISDPAKPVELSTFNAPMVINDMKLLNRMAYLATGAYGSSSAFLIFDLSDPRNPVKRGVYKPFPAGYYARIGISGSTVFVTEVMDFGSGVFALNVSDPDHPVEIGETLNLGYNFSPRIAADATRLYVYNGHVLIFDFANDLSNPIATFDVPATQTLNLTVVNGFAYFACGPNGMHIMDVNDPAHPKKVGSHPAGGYAQDIAVSAGMAYVTNPTSGVLIIDATEPTAPMLRSTCATTTPKMTSVSGTTAAVFNDDAVNILDVSDPDQPRIAGTYAPPLLRASTDFNDFHVSGNTAYVSTTSNGIRVVDVSDPTSPGLKASYFVKENGSFANMYPEGGMLFTNADRSFMIYDLDHLVFHDPIGHCLLPQMIMELKINGSYFYAADWTSGLQIIDCSVTTHPVVRAQLITQFEMPQSVALSGDYVYLACGLSSNGPAGRMRIIDVKDIDHPVNRGFFNYQLRAKSICVRDELAYVAWFEGLSILDVHNPDNPVQVGALPIMHLNKMTIQGRCVFVCGMTGVTVVDISDPAHPAVAATFEAYDTACDIAVAGELIYVLDRLRGLYILRAPGLPSRVRNYQFYE